MTNGIEVVLDFEGENELAAGKFLAKDTNPNLDDSGNLKYECVECVSQGTDVQKQGIDNVLGVNVDAVDCYPSCSNGSIPLGVGEEDSAIKAPQLNSSSCVEISHLRKDNCGSDSFFSELASRDSCPEAPSPGDSQLNSGISDSPSNNNPVDANSDADESMNEGSPSGAVKNTLEDSVPLNGRLSDHCFDDLEMDDINMEVVIYPDYVLYRDNICSGSLVTFSCTGIKIEDLSASQNQGTFTFERGIDDIVQIECQWYQRIGSVVCKLRVLSKDAIQDEHGISGIEELKFAVVEPNWSEKQEIVTSLNVKYMDLWDVVIEDDAETDEDNSFGHRHYFPNFDEPFEDVVYPKGDADAVSISKRDVDLLQPETFVNDTIIDFYIKYLKNQIQPEEKHRFHFFNSFFFRKLADLDKDPSSISDGRAAYLRVHKWTRKVDIFAKDYIFIPVNFNLHWSLIVICHPSEVTAFKDLDESEKVPCILHMDSIKGTHAGLKNLVQSYLWEEWKGRHKDASEDISSKFLNLRFVELELPQQENSFDCGLFLLHYLELFLLGAPVNFSPFKLTKFSNFLNVDWFPPSEASLKRTLIQKLVFDLLENRYRAAVCHNEHQSSRFPENNENGMGMEFDSEQCSLAIAQPGNMSNSGDREGIGITLLGAASLRNLQSVDNSRLVLKELFEPEAGESLLTQYQSFGQPSSHYHFNGVISLREQEDVETDEEFVYLASGEKDLQLTTELAPQASTIAYSSRCFGAEGSWNQELMQGEDDVNSSTETSSCDSDDSGDVGIIENNPFAENAIQSLKVRTDKQRSPLMDNIGCLTEGLAPVSSEKLESFAIGGSEEPNEMHNNGSIDLHSSQENLTTLFQDPNLNENMYQGSETVENGEVASDDIQVIGNDLVYKQQASKSDDFQVLGNYLLVEPYEQQAAKSDDVEVIGNHLLGGFYEQAAKNDDVQESGTDPLGESYEQQAAKGDDVQAIGKDHPGDSLEQEAAKGDDVQAIGKDLPGDSFEQEAAKGDDVQVVCNHLPVDSYEEQAAKGDDVQNTGNDPLGESYEQRATKRLRLTPPPEGKGGLDGSLSEDLHL